MGINATVQKATQHLEHLHSAVRSENLLVMRDSLTTARSHLLASAGLADSFTLEALARDYLLLSNRARTVAITQAARAVQKSAYSGGADTEGSLATYTNTCIHAEQAAQAIQRLAQIVLSAPEHYAATPITVMIEGVTKNSSDALVRIATQFGTVRQFALVPQFGVRCAPPLANELLKRSKGIFPGQVSIRPARTYAVRPIVSQACGEAPDWNLSMLGVTRAWQYSRGQGASVAIIDTGIDHRHTELEGRFTDGLGVDLVDNSSSMDKNGHGTHVAGTVAGATVGVAPDATLYAVRVLDENGFGDEATVLAGIEWAIQKHVSVINMSLGSDEPSDVERELVRIAAMQGIAVACAAGNDGNSSYNYPASYPGAISVAALTSTKAHAKFSNRNNMVDLSAPGESIYSLTPGGGYTYLSGTSMATPHVAGACALLRSAGIDAMEEQLKRTAEKLGDAKLYGAGLIRPAEALQHGK